MCVTLRVRVCVCVFMRTEAQTEKRVTEKEAQQIFPLATVIVTADNYEKVLLIFPCLFRLNYVV